MNEEKFIYEIYSTQEEVRGHIQECEGKHMQQVAYSSFHDALTQICYGCKKIRSNIKWTTSPYRIFMSYLFKKPVSFHQKSFRAEGLIPASPCAWNKENKMKEKKENKKLDSGEEYLKIKIVGHETITAFQNKNREEGQPHYSGYGVRIWVKKKRWNATFVNKKRKNLMFKEQKLDWLRYV